MLFIHSFIIFSAWLQVTSSLVGCSTIAIITTSSANAETVTPLEYSNRRRLSYWTFLQIGWLRADSLVSYHPMPDRGVLIQRYWMRFFRLTHPIFLWLRFKVIPPNLEYDISMIAESCFIKYLPHRDVSNQWWSTIDSDSLLLDVATQIWFIITRSEEAISSSGTGPLYLLILHSMRDT